MNRRNPDPVSRAAWALDSRRTSRSRSPSSSTYWAMLAGTVGSTCWANHMPAVPARGETHRAAPLPHSSSSFPSRRYPASPNPNLPLTVGRRPTCAPTCGAHHRTPRISADQVRIVTASPAAGPPTGLTTQPQTLPTGNNRSRQVTRRSYQVPFAYTPAQSTGPYQRTNGRGQDTVSLLRR